MTSHFFDHRQVDRELTLGEEREDCLFSLELNVLLGPRLRGGRGLVILMQAGLPHGACQGWAESLS
jgi:hypothetical protein